MRTHALRPSRITTQTLQRLMLVSAVIALGAIITAGTVFVQRTPSLSTRALLAAAQGPFLAMEFANIADASQQPTTTARAVPALTYHRIVSDSSDINNVTYSNFKDQMATLKRAGWETVTLEEFEQFIRGERSLPEKSFLLTFDDATRDSFYPVDPILKALGYEAVNFVIVESSRTQKTIYYLTPREIQYMLDTGRWSIGSHSYDGHRPYPTDPNGGTGIFFADRLWIPDQNRVETDEEFRARVRDDLARARSELEAAYNLDIESFAFPLGNETGLEGANNFPGGASITEEEAHKLYPFGYLQTNSQQFTANFPRTTPYLSDGFRIWRIHVDYDWDGQRVLEILENSLPKPLPFEDDFSTNKGWISAWGSMELGRNNFTLRAVPESSAASSFLDGTASWDNYTFDAAVNWQQGHAIVLVDVLRSSTYHSCVFSPGAVRIQRTVDGMTQTLAELQDPRIQYGESRIGARVHGSTIECTWNFASILENHSRDFAGGIGLQTWAETQGTAALQVSSIIVRPYGQ